MDNMKLVKGNEYVFTFAPLPFKTNPILLDKSNHTTSNSSYKLERTQVRGQQDGAVGKGNCC